MRRITKTYPRTVVEEVQVCDTCEQEKPLILIGYWASSCRYDGCNQNSERFEFCSIQCFLKSIDTISSNLGDDGYFETLSLSLDSTQDEFDAFVAFLKAYKPS